MTRRRLSSVVALLLVGTAAATIGTGDAGATTAVPRWKTAPRALSGLKLIPTVDLQAPKVPAAPRVSAVSTTTMTLTWGTARDNVGIAGYGVYLNGSRIATTGLRSYTISALRCGTTYKVGVDAYDASQNRSGVSSVLAGTAPCVDATPPTAPTTVRQSGWSQTGLAVEWKAASDNVGVAGYNVYRDGVPVAMTQQSSAWIGGLVCGAGYSVSVDAYDAAGNHSPRTTAIVNTTACVDTSPPSNPPNLRVTGTTESAVSIGWEPAADDRGVVEYRISLNDLYMRSTTGTAASFTGLSCGLSYVVKVVAVDAAGNTSPGASVIAPTTICPTNSGSDTQPPTQPSGLVRRDATTTSVTLAWTASTDNTGVAGYGIYRGDTKVADSSVTAYALEGLACATTYTLSVDAVDASGNRSGRTTVVAATEPCQDTLAPTPPTGLTASLRNETSITLTWQPSTDAGGVAGYRVYRDGALAGSTTSTSYTAAGLACGTSYTIGVEAYDASGNHSTRPATIVSTVTCSDTSPPTTPTSFATSGATATSLAVSWSPSSDNRAVAGYSLYVGGTAIGTTSQTSHTFSGLTCGTSYSLGVEAYDAAGNRSQRASLSATTAACAPAPTPLPTGSIYVSTTGSDANPCTQAQPCLTFGRAYKAAAPGATVLVAAGTYPGQEIDHDPAKPLTGASVVFAPASGSVTVNGTLHFGQDQFDRKGPKGVTVRDMTVTYLRAWPGSERLVWENIDSVHFDLDAKDSTIRGGDFGPCQAPRDDASCLSRIFGSSSNVLVENSSFHDVTSTDLANYHVDGMAIFGGENVTLRGNTFFANMITNIRVQNCCGNVPIRNLVVENNWFALPLQGDGVSTNANAVDIDSTVPGLKIRFNSFAEGSYPQITGAQSDAQLTGNLLTHVSCVPGVAYSYNVFKPWSQVQGQTACSSTDKKVSSLGYLSAGYGLSSTSPAIDFVPTSVGCPAKDLVGTARPLGLGCDAGASERQ